VEAAAEALKITPDDLKSFGITMRSYRAARRSHTDYDELRAFSTPPQAGPGVPARTIRHEIREHRYQKFRRMGVVSTIA